MWQFSPQFRASGATEFRGNGQTSQATMSPTPPCAGAATEPGRRRLRVLHLEDSELDHELLAEELRRGGLQAAITRVDTPAGFRRALEESSWDVILSDYRMPGFSGLDALSMLRASGHLVPFIILSGVIGEDTAVDAMRHGATDYLLKGRTARLVPAIERALQNADALRARAHSDYELAQSRLRLQALAQHLQVSIETERAAMAREIHDEVGSALTALNFELGWIERHATDEPTRRRARQAVEVLQQALSTAQRLMLNLRPAILDQGLAPALHWLCAGFRERHGVGCTLRTPQTLPTVAADVALTAFRTVQEALTNAAKHSGARQVTVDLMHAEDLLSVEISDDGRGWSPADLDKPRSFGLRGLRERALATGGWLDLASGPQGSSVILSLPLVPEHTA